MTKQDCSAGATSRKIQEQIKNLRASGHVVNVYHVRYFPNVGCLENGKISNYMTQRQFLKCAIEGTLLTPGGNNFPQVSVAAAGRVFNQEASPYGGYTLIEVRNGEQTIALGRFKASIVNKKGNRLPFTKRIGYQAAWGRVTKKLLGRAYAGLKAISGKECHE